MPRQSAKSSARLWLRRETRRALSLPSAPAGNILDLSACCFLVSAQRQSSCLKAKEGTRAGKCLVGNQGLGDPLLALGLAGVGTATRRGLGFIESLLLQREPAHLPLLPCQQNVKMGKCERYILCSTVCNVDDGSTTDQTQLSAPLDNGSGCLIPARSGACRACLLSFPSAASSGSAGPPR